MGEGLGLMLQEVHIGTPIEKCREINTMLLQDEEQDGGYEKDVFDNLIYRYEEPNGMTRWDSPLFTVPFDDEAPPYEDIWEAMIGSEGKAKVVKPNTATAVVRFLSPTAQSFSPTKYLTNIRPATSDGIRLPLRIGQVYPGDPHHHTGLAERPSR